MNEAANAMDLFAQLEKMAPPGSNLKFPPPVFSEMQAKFIAYTPGKSLTVRVPVLEKYQNPLGFMQGGMLVTAMDNTFGPLSYSLAPPSVTTQMNTSYLRPVGPTVPYVDIRATLVHKSRRQLLMECKVLDPEGQTVAIAQCTNMILEARPPKG